MALSACSCFAMESLKMCNIIWNEPNQIPFPVIKQKTNENIGAIPHKRSVLTCTSDVYRSISSKSTSRTFDCTDSLYITMVIKYEMWSFDDDYYLLKSFHWPFHLSNLTSELHTHTFRIYITIYMCIFVSLFSFCPHSNNCRSLSYMHTHLIPFCLSFYFSFLFIIHVECRSEQINHVQISNSNTLSALFPHGLPWAY